MRQRGIAALIIHTPRANIVWKGWTSGRYKYLDRHGDRERARETEPKRREIVKRGYNEIEDTWTKVKRGLFRIISVETE